jgi:hypothetical protein
MPGPRVTVVELPINPPFAGNLLVQASGRGLREGPTSSLVYCTPRLGSEEIGTVVTTQFTEQIGDVGIALTGAKTIAGGPQTVSVQCEEQFPEPAADVLRLTMFALVTG